MSLTPRVVSDCIFRDSKQKSPRPCVETKCDKHELQENHRRSEPHICTDMCSCWDRYLDGREAIEEETTKGFQDVWLTHHGTLDPGFTYSTLDDSLSKRVRFCGVSWGTK